MMTDDKVTAPSGTDPDEPALILRHAVRRALERPDYIYPLAGAGACYNLVDEVSLADDDFPAFRLRQRGVVVTAEQPLCCIVGQAALDAGWDRAVLRNTDSAVKLLGYGYAGEAAVAVDALQRLQEQQDAGVTWGEALVAVWGEVPSAFTPDVLGAEHADLLDRFLAGRKEAARCLLS